MKVAARPFAPGTASSWGAPALRSLRTLIVPVGLLILWQVVVEAGVYSRSQLASPVDVWRAAQQLAEADRLWIHFEISIERILKGFVIGSGIAIALGLLVGLSRLAEDVIGPTIQAVRTIPSLAWVPLFVLWLGIGEQPKITLVALGVFFPVYTNLVSGVRQIDRKLIEAATAYGYRHFSLAWEVMLPAALPSLLTGLRLGLAQGWLFLVAAELIGASRGLGYLLVDGQNSARADIIIMSIISLAIVGKASDVLLALVERRLLRWSDTYRTA